jgi:fatty acid desaturase
LTAPPPDRPGASPARDARAWAATLARYREPDPRRSVLELLATAVPFAALWLLAWACLGLGYWLSLLLAVPAAGFLVRLFMIQHDCGHGSFFRRRRANDWLGRALGVLTLTPYDHWRRTHAVHHATSGNLDRRGTGDVATLTVREYMAPGAKRLATLPFRISSTGWPSRFGIIAGLSLKMAGQHPRGFRAGIDWSRRLRMEAVQVSGSAVRYRIAGRPVSGTGPNPATGPACRATRKTLRPTSAQARRRSTPRWPGSRRLPSSC